LANFTVTLTFQKANLKVFASKNHNRPSEPLRRAPLKRTFGWVNAPEKATSRLILLDLTKLPIPPPKMQAPAIDLYSNTSVTLSRLSQDTGA